MLKYIIKTVVCLSLLTSFICNKAAAQFHSDTLYGLRLGVDLSRIVVHYANPYRTDITVHADARIDSDWYLAAEGGWNTTHLDNSPVFDYKSHGIFLKAGFDYNLLKPKFPFGSNMIYLGFRYGIARMNMEIPEYQIQHPYWGNVNSSFPSKMLYPQWAEAILGLKVEVLNNLFLSWGLHIRVLTIKGFGDKVRPFVIPGFGKSTSNAVFDTNYNISYRIPLWKPKHKEVVKPDEGETKSKKALTAKKAKKTRKVR